MGKLAFYAVRVGRLPGIYTTWTEASRHVTGYSGAQFKGFPSMEQAAAWLVSPGAHPVRVAMPPKRLAAVDLKPRLRIPPPPVLGTHARALAGGIAPLRDHELMVYCDGACPCNGTERARAGIGVWFAADDPYNLSERLPPTIRQTNQTAEVIAAHRALEQVRARGHTGPVTVVTDSLYVVQAMSAWRFRWQAQGWTTKLINKSLLRPLAELVDAMGGRDYILFYHVKGHATTHGNNEADRLATAGAEEH